MLVSGEPTNLFSLPIQDYGATNGVSIGKTDEINLTVPSELAIRVNTYIREQRDADQERVHVPAADEILFRRLLPSAEVDAQADGRQRVDCDDRPIQRVQSEFAAEKSVNPSAESAQRRGRQKDK